MTGSGGVSSACWAAGCLWKLGVECGGAGEAREGEAGTSDQLIEKT